VRGDRSGAANSGWEHLVAVGVVAGDLRPATIAHYGGVTIAEASTALDAARLAGAVTAGGAGGAPVTIDPIEQVRVLAALPAERVADLHATIARELFTQGPARLDDAVRHARAAAASAPTDDLVAMADRAGRMSLRLGDYASARTLLQLAADLDRSDDLRARATRLCDLARAIDGTGDLPASQEALALAVSLAELAGDGSLLVRAAVQVALPSDWYFGDARSVGMLVRAEELDLGPDDRVLVRAARAFAENRIPLMADNGQQIAWVTRPSVAREHAAAALGEAEGRPDFVRLVALLAWRTTHRAPAFLQQRRQVSSEALDLAQRLQDPALQVEAAVMLGVDALESGDRSLFDQACAVIRWVALRDGNPRLEWRAHTVAAGAAFLDGSTAIAAEHAAAARTVGERASLPGWLSAEMMFLGEGLITIDDPATMGSHLYDESFPGMANPIGRACVAYLFARTGDLTTAEHHARRAFRQLEDEASLLLLGTRLAHAAALVAAPDLCHDLIAVLEPWADHVAVDSNLWWCDGPVALWLAHLHQATGAGDRARELVTAAGEVARAVNDVRGRQRAERLAALLDAAAGRSRSSRVAAGATGAGPRTSDPVALTTREEAVLRLLATGASNPEIARRLAYSVSTIRDDVSSVYRKLGVAKRPEAVTRAIALGLVTPG